MTETIICQLLTSWQAEISPAEDPEAPPVTTLTPRAAREHRFLSWRDVTGEQAETLLQAPNLVVIEATLPSAQLAALEADPNLFILWSDRK